MLLGMYYQAVLITSFQSLSRIKIYEYLLIQFMFYDRVACKVRDLEINTRDWDYTQLKHQQCTLYLLLLFLPISNKLLWPSW